MILLTYESLGAIEEQLLFSGTCLFENLDFIVHLWISFIDCFKSVNKCERIETQIALNLKVYVLIIGLHESSDHTIVSRLIVNGSVANSTHSGLGTLGTIFFFLFNDSSIGN